MQHSFDTTPLARQLTLKQMLAELKYSSAPFKIGFVTLLLVAFVPLIIFMLVASQVVTNLGALAFIVMLSVGGLWGLRDLYHELNEIATARQFAVANRLQFIVISRRLGILARHFASVCMCRIRCAA